MIKSSAIPTALYADFLEKPWPGSMPRWVPSLARTSRAMTVVQGSVATAFGLKCRCGDFDFMNITFAGVLANRLSVLARRIVTRARFRGEAAFHSYCFRVATARHEVGAYGSLSSIPEGVPAGVVIVLAAVIILRTTGAAWIHRCRNDARRRIAAADLRSFGIGG
jgi:hypothetical protein